METFDSVAHENRIIGKQHIPKTCSSLRDWNVDFSRTVWVQLQKEKAKLLLKKTGFGYKSVNIDKCVI